MPADLEKTYDRLYAYCAESGFAGHDPFDGLNSGVFQLTPLKKMRLARLAWQQMVKRSPVDLRRLLRVPKGLNSKGLALFALAELSRFRATQDKVHAENARSLVEKLLETKIAGETPDGRPTTAFGYNFDWQSRHFYAPRGTPAVVPTAFAAQALIEAFGDLGDERYLAAAEQICTFILTGLHRSVDDEDGLCFSYTPLDTSIVYNASLLAGETLARVGAIQHNSEYLLLAANAARFAVRRQRADGAWAYGEAANQSWVDNFHTAYVLRSLRTIASKVPELGSEISDAVESGYAYWREEFFLPNGAPKYYDTAFYPIDIHACAASIVVLSEFSDGAAGRRVAEWTVGHLLDPKGFFYYQMRTRLTVKTPFMRWSQAWMAYALATLLEAADRG